MSFSKFELVKKKERKKKRVCFEDEVKQEIKNAEDI